MDEHLNLVAQGLLDVFQNPSLAIKEFGKITQLSLPDCIAVFSELENNKSAAKISEVEQLFNLLETQFMTAKLPDYVSKVQEIVVENINRPSGIRKSKKNIFQIVKNYPKSEVEFILGELGKSIVSFSEKINENHPSLNEINKGSFVFGGSDYNRIQEALDFSKICQNQNFQELPRIVSKWFNRYYADNVTKIYAKPPARLLKSKEDREKARQVCRAKRVDLTNISVSRKSWDAIPTDFVPFCRMGPGFKEKSDYLRRILVQLKKLNLAEQAAAIHKELESFDSILSDQYNGFVRIKMDTAAAIAAKLMGGIWSNDVNGVKIPSSYFKLPFWQCESAAQKKLLSFVNKSSIDDIIGDMPAIETAKIFPSQQRKKNAKENLLFDYRPQAYPLAHIDVPCPPRVKEVLDSLESHVDMDGNPIFDHYWLVVPSIAISENDNSESQFCHEGVIYRFKEGFREVFDKYLILTDQVFPILMGEHVSNRACYFICFWA